MNFLCCSELEQAKKAYGIFSSGGDELLLLMRDGYAIVDEKCNYSFNEEIWLNQEHIYKDHQMMWVMSQYSSIA